jgi:hypothetical protein
LAAAAGRRSRVGVRRSTRVEPDRFPVERSPREAGRQLVILERALLAEGGSATDDRCGRVVGRLSRAAARCQEQQQGREQREPHAEKSECFCKRKHVSCYQGAREGYREDGQQGERAQGDLRRRACDRAGRDGRRVPRCRHRPRPPYLQHPVDHSEDVLTKERAGGTPHHQLPAPRPETPLSHRQFARADLEQCRLPSARAGSSTQPS